MQRTVTIRQRVLICDTCEETLAVVDAIATSYPESDTGNARSSVLANVTYRCDPPERDACHKQWGESTITSAARLNTDLPGCYWERGVA
jgi:hypothetical protein